MNIHQMKGLLLLHVDILHTTVALLVMTKVFSVTYLASQIEKKAIVLLRKPP